MYYLPQCIVYVANKLAIVISLRSLKKKSELVSNGGKVVITEVDSLKKGDGCYRGGLFNGGENAHVREVAVLMEEEWSCCTLMGERMVILQRWPI